MEIVSLESVYHRVAWGGVLRFRTLCGMAAKYENCDVIETGTVRKVTCLACLGS